jgi:hypothetical protein
VLTAQVASLQDKTCNCKEGPKLVGQGTADVPFELEYADEVVLPSPNPSSYATPPIENTVPVPTPGPASTLAASDKENCGRCVLQPIHQLVKIEDEVMEVDRAEDAPRVAEVRPVTKGQRCKRSRRRPAHRMTASANPYPRPVESDGDESGRGEERGFRYRVLRPYRQVASELQLRRRIRLAWQDPTQGSDEGEGGSLYGDGGELVDYVDSAGEQSPGDGDVGPGVPEFGDIWEADRSARRSLFLSA